MSQVSKDGDKLILELADGDSSSTWNGLNLQLLPPLLLGLLAPFMAVNYFDPESVRHLKMPIFFFLLFMFVVCTALFFYTAHVPGQMQAITVNRADRTVEITWQNMLATTSQIVPFSDITALRCRNDYDDDGYAQTVAEIVMGSNGALQLPQSTTEEQLRPLRAAIGLV